ncbi:MAG: class I SAM-dependent methyltransferase [Chloroflexota bacterium]
MTGLCAKWSAYLDQQHRHPTGFIGQLIGERMLRQHAPETAWSIDLLDLQPTDHVLEIGFGAGRGLALMLERTPNGRVVGLDLSATMVQAAAKRNTVALTNGYLSLLRGDIVSLPFRTHRFDKIISVHTFYFWLEPSAIFLQLLPLLARGGRCVVTFATAQTELTGERVYWPLHDRANNIVGILNQTPGISATLISGPDSRQFNNVAVVVEKL